MMGGRQLRRLAALVVVLALLRPHEAQQPQNLLANPNFELVDASGWPRNWSRGSAFARSTAQHVPGAGASLRYRNYDPSLFQFVTQRVGTAQAGHRYTTSSAVRAAGLNPSAFGRRATICPQ